MRPFFQLEEIVHSVSLLLLQLLFADFSLPKMRFFCDLESLYLKLLVEAYINTHFVKASLIVVG